MLHGICVWGGFSKSRVRSGCTGECGELCKSRVRCGHTGVRIEADRSRVDVDTHLAVHGMDWIEGRGRSFATCQLIIRITDCTGG